MRHLAVCFALAAIPASAAERAAYVGVIDAGSSGSRLQVYRFTDSGVDDVLDLSSEARPLASFAADPAEAGDRALRPLLGALDRELSARGVAKTDIDMHVLATGGMRLLPAPAAQAVEASVRRAIVAGGYRPGRIETISGEMEGFYAWLDVNAMLGRFAPGQTPAGVVEVGGASMQIAYASNSAAGPGVVTASFNGASYHVRSVSLLGLGVEESRKSLMATREGGACYPEGIVSALPTAEGARGAFDAERCAQGVLRVVAEPAGAAPRDELKGMPFVGLGRPLTGVLADWRLPLDRPADMKDAAREKCAQPWDAFVKAYGDTPYTPYLCVNSVYLATLLFHPQALGFAPDQIVVADKIGGRRPYWTRGAALMLRDAK